MPAINVYVSADLKRRMDRRKDINWSAHATTAFEKALAPPRYEDFLAAYTTPRLPTKA